MLKLAVLLYIKSIITTMPFNIMNWYKDDIFSDKLVLIFKKYLNEGDSAVTRHIIALLICAGRPIEFSNLVRSYIGSIGKNSYYLGDLNSNLRHNYTTQFMNDNELKQTESLIKVCHEKRRTGSQLPGRASVAKVSDDIIPDRGEIKEG
ncbi:MAG: hypothetical protein R3Y08_05480 [Rikenellaceae bacterium]